MTRRVVAAPVTPRAIVTVLPKMTVAAITLVSVVIVIIDLLVPWALDDRHDIPAERWLAVAGFEDPHGIAVWWSSVLFLLVALLAYTRSQIGPDVRRAARWRWQALAALFLWTSFDHATHAHEEVARLFSRYLHVPEGVGALAFLLLAAAAVAGVPLFRAASPSARLRLAVASIAVVLGAWGVDAFTQLGTDTPDLASRAIEAVLEWTGLVTLAQVLSDPAAWPLPRPETDDG
jgi:hypothetical protein